MREVSAVADALKGHVKKLKERAQSSTEAFKREMTSAHEGLSKLDAMTAELKDANQEVSAALAEFGTNFPPSEDTFEAPRSDANGVTLNKG